MTGPFLPMKSCVLKEKEEMRGDIQAAVQQFLAAFLKRMVPSELGVFIIPCIVSASDPTSAKGLKLRHPLTEPLAD
ncbi:hypothetical protein [Metabacillus sp. 84]|uniref:hypothetical protein n=1 Tax=Metabacillus sp. 84 TaxID=3404705 RepID=UPI003CF75AA0